MKILPEKIEELIDTFGSLPGIGPKSAARIVLFLHKAPSGLSERLAEEIVSAKKDVMVCSKCFNFSDSDICPVCSSLERENGQLLVVVDSLALLAVERTRAYAGLYHVLGGVISPLRGIGPDEIRIGELIKRVRGDSIDEVILALNPDMEGDATSLYIQNEIEALGKDIKITRLAQGLSKGADLDYVDGGTIENALKDRRDV